MWESGGMITNAVQSHIKKDMWSPYMTVRRLNFLKRYGWTLSSCGRKLVLQTRKKPEKNPDDKKERESEKKKSFFIWQFSKKKKEKKRKKLVEPMGCWSGQLRGLLISFCSFGVHEVNNRCPTGWTMRQYTNQEWFYRWRPLKFCVRECLWPKNQKRTWWEWPKGPTSSSGPCPHCPVLTQVL